MNPNSGMTFIEIDFKEAVDYSTDKTDNTNATGGITGQPGTLSLNDSIQFWNPVQSNTTKGLTYQLITATSVFSGGKFTQTLEGNMAPIPMPEGAAEAEGRPDTGVPASPGPVPGNANAALGKDGLKLDNPIDIQIPDVSSIEINIEGEASPSNSDDDRQSYSKTTDTGGGSTTRYADGRVVVDDGRGFTTSSTPVTISALA